VGIRDLFSKRGKDEVVGAKILIASLDRKFVEWWNADSTCYAQFYPAPSVMVFEDIRALMETIAKGYDVVHLFCDVSPDGSIVDGRGIRTAGAILVQTCCDADVKLLWVASENKPEGYIKGFKAARLNVVMTIDRKGSRFAPFLEKLLSKMSAGETMPVAWASISPQIPNDPRQQDCPGCIFAAGRGGIKLR
jgi:hypothetical protein